jgi:hypothetical protein
LRPVRPFQRLVAASLPPVSQALGEWRQAWGVDERRNPNRARPVAWGCLKAISASAASTIAVRCVFASLGVRPAMLASLTATIGRAVDDGALSYSIGLARPHGALSPPPSEPRSEHELFHVGMTLIEIITRVTGWFGCGPDPRRKPWKACPPRYLVLTMKPALDEWLGSQLVALAQCGSDDHAPSPVPDLMPRPRAKGERRPAFYRLAPSAPQQRAFDPAPTRQRTPQPKIG